MIFFLTIPTTLSFIVVVVLLFHFPTGGHNNTHVRFKLKMIFIQLRWEMTNVSKVLRKCKSGIHIYILTKRWKTFPSFYDYQWKKTLLALQQQNNLHNC